MLRNTRYYLLVTIILLLTWHIALGQSFDALRKDQQRKVRSTTYLRISANDNSPHLLRLLGEYLPPLALESQPEGMLLEQVLQLYKGDTLLILGSRISDNPTDNGLGTIQVSDTNLVGFRASPSYDKPKTTQLHYVDSLPAWDSIMAHWKRTGRLPNLVRYDPNHPRESVELVHKLNRTPKVSGYIHENGSPLFDVHFKHFEASSVGGFFCLPTPTNTSAPELIPQKAGYYFSPDIVNITFENKARLKTFEGFKIPLDYGLSHRFDYDNNDDIRAQGAINNRVQFMEDDSLGLVGNYDKGAYIDAGLESRLALRSSFSIIARIKPTQYSDRNSILGKGNNFVLKLHQGYLTFTVPGVKDYQSFKSPIPRDKWSQVGLVLSESRNELRFYVNGKLTESMPLVADFEGSDYNLMMGSNLWEEYFIGQIKDVFIWDRELNESDVVQLHEQPNILRPAPTKTGLSPWWWALLPLVLILIYLWGNRSITNTHKKKQALLPIPQTSLAESPKNHVRLFGRFSLFDRHGNDIASRFSPMLKQIFLVVLWHSESSGKGISTKKLTEIIWPGLSPAKAKNTRGTNIQNLRHILSDCDHIRLVFKNKLWTVEMDAASQCDLTEVRQLLLAFTETPELLENNSLLERLTTHLSHGVFLANETLFWLEAKKEHMGNWVIENCLKLAQKLDTDSQGDTIYRLAEIMYQYDDLNEEALALKLQVLHAQGKHSLALKVYKSFITLYKSLYGTDYEKTMESFALKNH